MSNRIAPTGAIWVCGACGKTSKDRYGDPGTSWDESCMLNSRLCHEERGFDRWGIYGWRSFDTTSFPSTKCPVSEIVEDRQS